MTIYIKQQMMRLMRSKSECCSASIILVDTGCVSLVCNGCRKVLHEFDLPTSLMLNRKVMI